MTRLALLCVLLPLVWCAPAFAEPTAFVISEDSGSLSIIDTKTDEVRGTFKVGERPRGLAVTREGERAYVSLDDGTIIERDVWAKEMSGGTKLGRRTGAIDLSPDGRLLAAASPNQDEIVLLDLAMMRVVKKVPVPGGKGAANVVFSPDARWIYATTEQGAEIHVVDAKQGSVTSSIRVGPRLRGVAFHPDGSRAYVVAEEDGELVVIDVASQAIRARVKTASAPRAAAVHPDGKRVFVASAAGKVQVIDATANRIVAELDACIGPSSIAATPDGNKLYVTCSEANQVLVHDASSYKRVAQLSVGVKPVSVVIRRVDPAAGGTFVPGPQGKSS